MSVPLRRNRMNGIKVKVIAVAMNRRRTTSRGRGQSSHSEKTRNEMYNRECTLINANQKGKEIWKPEIQERYMACIRFVASRFVF